MTVIVNSCIQPEPPNGRKKTNIPFLFKGSKTGIFPLFVYSVAMRNLLRAKVQSEIQ